MALFKPYKITSDKLEDLAIKEGQLIVTTDTKKLYVDVSATERIEVTADAEVDLSNYVTTSILTSTIGEEASARQKQDQLLEQAIEDKVGADDIVAGSNVQVSHDDVSGHITISATDTNTNTTYTLSKSGSTITLSGSDGSSTSVTDANTTYSLGSFGITASAAELNKLDGVTATAAELNCVDGVTSNIQTQLNGKAAATHTHSNATTAAAGFLPKLGGGTTNYLRADGTWAKPPDTNTTYSTMTGATSSTAGKTGLVPAPAAGAATRYLRSDGTWQVPPDTNTNTTYTLTKSGSTITLTGSDGKKTSVTDSNTTYSLSSFGITATAAELNKLDGVTTTATQLNYLNTLTGNVQTQLNGKAASSHSHSYLPLAGGTMSTNAVIARTGSSTSWVTGRSVALLKTTTSGSSFYSPLWSCKTYQGSWDCGTYTSNTLHFSYITDTDFSKHNNAQTADIVFNTNGSITAKTFVGALSGNASTATTATQANYWTTARTLTFTGNVTGRVSVRGNANMSCALTLANDSVTSAKIAANAVGTSEIAANAVTLAKLGSDVGTVAVQTAEPTDSNVKLWIKI